MWHKLEQKIDTRFLDHGAYFKTTVFREAMKMSICNMLCCRNLIDASEPEGRGQVAESEEPHNRVGGLRRDRSNRLIFTRKVYDLPNVKWQKQLLEVFCTKVLLEILQNSQNNAFVKDLFIIKLEA